MSAPVNGKDPEILTRPHLLSAHYSGDERILDNLLKLIVTN
jgi:hypothetical protein